MDYFGIASNRLAINIQRVCEFDSFDNPERVWNTLSNPVIDLKLDKLQGRLIEDISEKENVDYKTAICYFLIFTMDYLGYHI